MRRILSITGTRADYGLMRPVHRAIAADGGLELHLVVTGMHLLPEFATSLAEVRAEAFGTLHEASMLLGEDSGKAMAQSLGLGLVAIAGIVQSVRPDVILLQGDRGEMLAGAIAGAHMNVPVVHMSGGDFSGSIDDSIRNSISKFAHFHLTTCEASTRRLLAMGEDAARIVEAGEPALDLLRTMTYMSRADLAAELALDAAMPIAVATLHPVTDEAALAAGQMTTTLEALADVGLQTVFTYPNADHGGRAMRDVLESWRGRPFLRIVANLGSHRYLSLLRQAAVLVGNSSSGILEAPSFKLPVVNIGSRQHGRLRASNVIDVGFDRAAIAAAMRAALDDPQFRTRLADCRNPYGDGHTAERTVDVLRRLALDPALTAKWRDGAGPFLARADGA
ncbi:MAG: UDP-N-acetylglucosamine 2-epimerase (hydrolyzing) [Alphaproteobacteria bacterium]|nr:UDP-N-acetylglucosamine 2-epimerase (hydrolyzing) [Alphaproteobacteria bacterium]